MHNHYGTLFSGRHDKTSNLLTPDRKWKTKIRTPAKSTWWTNEFYWDCLQDCWGVSYRSRNDLNASPSPKVHPSMAAVLQTVEAWTVQQNIQIVEYGKESLPGISVEVSFWVAPFLSENPYDILASLRVIQNSLYCLYVLGEGRAWYT